MGFLQIGLNVSNYEATKGHYNTGQVVRMSTRHDSPEDTRGPNVMIYEDQKRGFKHSICSQKHHDLFLLIAGIRVTLESLLPCPGFIIHCTFPPCGDSTPQLSGPHRCHIKRIWTRTYHSFPILSAGASQERSVRVIGPFYGLTQWHVEGPLLPAVWPNFSQF